MNKKLIIEVAVNETVLRSENRHVPLTPEEIAEDAYQCFQEGASIIHFHNRIADRADDGTYDASLNGSVEHYAETMRLIKDRCDVIPYPTYTYPGAAGREEAERGMHPHVKTLRDMPDIRLETFVLHLGATNIGRYDFKSGKFLFDRVSSHTHEQMAQFLAWCTESGLQPGFLIREPGQIRHLLMYREMGLLKDPIMVHLNLSDSVPYGPLPDVTGIQTLLNIFPAGVAYEWFIHNYTTFVHDPAYGDTHRELNVLAVAMGGHVRTGIGDKPEWDGEQLTNAEMVRRFVAVAKAAGREIATTDEARAMLGYSKVLAKTGELV
jgi:3-keto-5-aminohexanoate cleavage enzyme